LLFSDFCWQSERISLPLLHKGNTMRRSAPLLTAVALLVLPVSLIPQDQADHADRDHFERTVRFDGKWQTTVSCEPSRGALGFSYRFRQ